MLVTCISHICISHIIYICIYIYIYIYIYQIFKSSQDNWSSLINKMQVNVILIPSQWFYNTAKLEKKLLQCLICPVIMKSKKILYFFILGPRVLCLIVWNPLNKLSLTFFSTVLTPSCLHEGPGTFTSVVRACFLVVLKFVCYDAAKPWVSFFFLTGVCPFY
jgi:hypothetical protein